MRSNTLRRVLPLALLATLGAAPAPALSGDGYDYGAETPGVAQLFEAMTTAEECAPVEEHTCGASCTQGWKAGEKLGGLIVKDEASFAEFAPLFRAQFDAAGTSDHGRGRLLGFLAGCPSERTGALGEELFGTRPETFEDRHLIAFAAMGSEELARQLVARVESGHTAGIAPAAYLAFGGDDRGAQSLTRAAEADLALDTVSDALLAAAALDALACCAAQRAEEAPRTAPKHVDVVLLRVHDAVLADLDRGNLSAARNLALAAQVVTRKLEKHASGAYGLVLNNLETDVAWTLRAGAEKLVTAEQVFEVIEEITPIS